MTSTAAQITTNTPAGTRDPRVERTLAAVLAAAYELLITEGPDAVNHGQVASTAKVSRTTVYKHFRTRGDLLRATIEVMGKPLSTELSGDLRTDLQRMLADIIADLADRQRTRAIAAMIERAQHDPIVAEVRDDLVREAREQFRTIVDAGIASGELDNRIDHDLALSGLVGTFLFKRLMAGEQIDDDLATRAVDALIANHRPT